MDWVMTSGTRAMALLPEVIARILPATLPGVIAAESAIHRTDPATETDPLPAHTGFLNGKTGAAPGSRRRECLRHHTARQDIFVFTTG
ncbi:MAG: hypothetical protein WCH04_05645 [Gammaproteobacteria bacterium]